MANFNNLVIHVIHAKGLNLKGHKSMDIYVSLTTSGKGNWKSKVTTNPTKTTDGSCQWDEHCEFEIVDTDAEMHIHVNHKTVIGTTETLGQVILPLETMSRYQPPTWYRLTKKQGDQKDRGQLQLEWQFENKFASSISNFSLNRIEKEKKFEKLKRKMHLIGRSKKATMDTQSMASISLSRKSSFSSNASGLAFSSPSPNQMIMLSGPENFLSAAPSKGGSISLTTGEHSQSTNRLDSKDSQHRRDVTDGDGLSQYSANEFAMKGRRNDSQTFGREDASVADSDKQSLHSNYSTANHDSSKNITTKVRQKAEQLLHLRTKKHSENTANGDTSADVAHHSSVFSSLFHSSTNSAAAAAVGSHSALPANPTGSGNNHSRPSSIASSSGFASLGSGNAGALNENTSPEYLLSVIKHLRKELVEKENRIRDLEMYTDKLLSKIIDTNPELLQASPKPAKAYQ